MGCGNSKPNSQPRSVERDAGVQPRMSHSDISHLSDLSDLSDVSDRSFRKQRRHSSKKKAETEEKVGVHDNHDDNKEAETGIIGIGQDEKEITTAEEKEENRTIDEEIKEKKLKETTENDLKETMENKEKETTEVEDKEVKANAETENKETLENEETTEKEKKETTEIEETTENEEKETTEIEETTENEEKETTEIEETTENEEKETTENGKKDTTDMGDELNEQENNVDVEKNTAIDEKAVTEEESHLTMDTEKRETDKVKSNREVLLPAHTDTELKHNLDGDKGKEPLTNADNRYDDVYTPFDDEDEEEIDCDGYTPDSLGLMLRSVDYRSHPSNENEDTKPPVNAGELYTDREFPLKIAIVQGNSDIEWKRPKEFLKDPKLFSDGTSHYDIGQGSAGTCWFLSTVSVIADKKEIINKIVPTTAYNIEDPENYDGIFHARFYRFGHWEDIYIDDYVPVIHEQVLWGAKSITDSNELWVPLLEKAFARLHGSYDAIYGGQPGDAYLQLTGGIGERLDLENQDDRPITFFKRIKNALNSGSQVTCVVPDEFDNHLGLVGGHAYSLIGVAQVNETELICVRNPWGHGEWTGPWSDKSAEWSSLSDSDVKPARKDDGEFYVSLEDFLKYFSQTTICSLTPDFDCDGTSDSLKYQLSIFGEWTQEKSGPFSDLLRNPRYTFTITDEGMTEDGTVPFVVQIIQHCAKRSVDHTSMRCDVFKIHADKMRGNRRYCAVEIQGKKNNVYTTELQSSFRHKLKPGRYMIIPSTCDGGIEKAFLLRLFTSAALKNIKEVHIDTTVLSSENEDELIHDGKSYSLTFEKTIFGAFINGVNAGGQVSNRDSYSKNPQYLITVSSVGCSSCDPYNAKQEEPKYPVGFRLFPLDDDVNPPVDVNYLYNSYESSPSHCEGAQSKFMISWDVDVKYVLPAGRYVGLVHLDLPDTEKSFAVLFKSNTTIDIKGFQTE